MGLEATVWLALRSTAASSPVTTERPFSLPLRREYLKGSNRTAPSFRRTVVKKNVCSLSRRERHLNKY
ncbi:hypothetical protein SORBI_3010G143000 [Sorghum bicolor]|uniref:Uncharacterized protein n=1 Tax=Sorghum bicolor TaxID=4558 RepID=A0A194YJ62_SORBI|nr:hypothetical protein SORBI_3010G143000 [Sorghum bicolor]